MYIVLCDFNNYYNILSHVIAILSFIWNNDPYVIELSLQNLTKRKADIFRPIDRSAETLSLKPVNLVRGM